LILLKECSVDVECRGVLFAITLNERAKSVKLRVVRLCVLHFCEKEYLYYPKMESLKSKGRIVTYNVLQWCVRLPLKRIGPAETLQITKRIAFLTLDMS